MPPRSSATTGDPAAPAAHAAHLTATPAHPPRGEAKRPQAAPGL
jgi:hypothetical protein